MGFLVLASFQFLSTPSARRATDEVAKRMYQAEHFYPRPPRGGRQSYRKNVALSYTISIHALREEGDGLPTELKNAIKVFLSTPSARRAT